MICKYLSLVAILILLFSCTTEKSNPLTSSITTIPTEETESDLTIMGKVMDTSLSARIILLEEPVEGISIIALTDGSKLLSEGHGEITLGDIQNGVTVRASGIPGESNTLLANQVLVLETDVPEVILPEIQGYLTFPYRSADAGNFSLQAGDDIVIAWEDAPAGAGPYEIIYFRFDDVEQMLLGADFDSLDGVEAALHVGENLAGRIEGVAYYDGGHKIRSLSSAIYSGELPPEGICSLSGGGIGVIKLYNQPDIESGGFAYLIPGRYAVILEKTGNGWYLIDAIIAIDSTTGQASDGVGWVNDQNGISLHGSCEGVPFTAEE
jgi:hypothetical protein